MELAIVSVVLCCQSYYSVGLVPRTPEQAQTIVLAHVDFAQYMTGLLGIPR